MCAQTRGTVSSQGRGSSTGHAVATRACPSVIRPSSFAALARLANATLQRPTSGSRVRTVDIGAS